MLVNHCHFSLGPSITDSSKPPVMFNVAKVFEVPIPSQTSWVATCDMHCRHVTIFASVMLVNHHITFSAYGFIYKCSSLLLLDYTWRISAQCTKFLSPVMIPLCVYIRILPNMYLQIAFSNVHICLDFAACSSFIFDCWFFSSLCTQCPRFLLCITLVQKG